MEFLHGSVMAIQTALGENELVSWSRCLLSMCVFITAVSPTYRRNILQSLYSFSSTRLYTLSLKSFSTKSHEPEVNVTVPSAFALTMYIVFVE